jgi:hypothetical protein
MYQVPVVKVGGPWGGGSSWGYQAKCSFQISSSWPSGTFLVDLNLNQQTSNLQVKQGSMKINCSFLSYIHFVVKTHLRMWWCRF